MKYWRDFCSENESLLSLIPTIDYSDPFSCAYRYDKTNTPNIDYPAAFTIRFGECISLMAVAKIDEMMKNFVENNADVFKEVIRAKCLHICNYSSNPFVDIKKILKNLRCFIKKEFDKVVNEKIVEGHFGNFLNELIIWRRQVVEPEIVDIGKSSIIKIIVGDMCESLVRCLYDCLYDMVSSFSFHIASSWSNASKVGSYLHTIESKLEIKIHPEDGYDILSIRRNFLAKSRKVIWDKFFSMLKKKHKFSDGTVISKVDWSEISKKLFPVAQGSVRHLLDMERLELSRLLSKLRVVEDINEFNFSSSGTREATLKERNYFLKLAIGSADRQTKDLFRKVWLSLVEVPVDDKISHDTSDTLEPVDEGESSVDVMLPVELNCHSLGVGANKIINKWKLNLHPDDDKLILFIRRKFSTEMRDYLRTLFSGMLEEKAVLASGKELCNCSWTAISSELYPIAVESVGPIIENEYRELDKVLSEVRIVDVNNSDGCSYIIRKVTGEEKNSL
ncbi:hypothetical protein, partial [Candidatus Ichthyocystis hellenicum]|uniref:hypothetical protein n=1 Tax=Candidatus Ichthyocystis hellenicum TaxID=1561003 RepID=UPI001112627F